MSEQEKKRQRIYDLLNAETKPKFLYLPYTKQRKKVFFFIEKELFKERGGGGGSNKKEKERLLTALATTIKRGPTTSIRKQSNELKVHEKTVRIAIKQDSSPERNPFDYAIFGIG